MAGSRTIGRGGALLLAVCLMTTACGKAESTGAGNGGTGGDSAGGSNAAGTAGAAGTSAGGTSAGAAGDSGAGVGGEPALGWEPPIGVPRPGFGITDNHRDYEGETYDFGDGPEPYRMGAHGPYTHYIDASHPACSDLDPFGTESVPRCSFPPAENAPFYETIFAEGSVVELHGSYALSGSDIRILARGTAQRPVFIRGVGAPVLRELDTLTLTGSYLIAEGLTCDGCNFTVSNDAAGQLPDHITVRRCEIARHPYASGVALFGSDILFWENDVHHHHSYDAAGVSVGPSTERVWILDNHIHHNDGPGVEVSVNGGTNPPDSVYVGRNHIHSDRAGGVHVGQASNVVISENRIESYRSVPPSGEWCFDDGTGCRMIAPSDVGEFDGAGIVVGVAGGVPRAHGSPTDTWLLHNEIRDAQHGIRLEGADEIWLIGNRIHDVREHGIALEAPGRAHLLANLLHDVEVGIQQSLHDTTSIAAANNIFSSVRGLAIRVQSSPVTESSSFSHNLFFAAGAPVAILWGNTSASANSATEIDAIAGFEATVFTTPGFVDAAAGNFRPAPDSALTDVGRPDPAYAKFLEVYGIDIAVDSDRRPRPMGAAWDIGPYEH